MQRKEPQANNSEKIAPSDVEIRQVKSKRKRKPKNEAPSDADIQQIKSQVVVNTKIDRILYLLDDTARGMFPKMSEGNKAGIRKWFLKETHRIDAELDELEEIKKSSDRPYEREERTKKELRAPKKPRDEKVVIDLT